MGPTASAFPSPFPYTDFQSFNQFPFTLDSSATPRIIYASWSACFNLPSFRHLIANVNRHPTWTRRVRPALPCKWFVPFKLPWYAPFVLRWRPMGHRPFLALIKIIRSRSSRIFFMLRSTLQFFLCAADYKQPWLIEIQCNSLCVCFLFSYQFSLS